MRAYSVTLNCYDVTYIQIEYNVYTNTILIVYNIIYIIARYFNKMSSNARLQGGPKLL